MTWSGALTCAACAFVSRQLGPGTPCPSHAGLWSVRASGEPSSRAAPLPSADCPWAFPSIGTRACWCCMDASARSTQALSNPRAWASRRSLTG